MPFVQYTGLPGSPVIEVPSGSVAAYNALGWANHPGPATKPTFPGPPATHGTSVLVKHPNLPGKTFKVPYISYYGYGSGVGGLQTLGWQLGP